MIFSTLKRGPWRRKPPRPASPKRALYEARIRAAREHRDRDKALAWGGEYRSVFLAGVFKLSGCAACSRHDPRGFHAHHVVHRSRKGRGESLVPLCPDCHVEDGRGGVEARAARLHGVDLAEVAAALAKRGRELGFLPVERCSSCGTWHSRRFMLDEVDSSSCAVRRLCVACAPEGPR